MVVVPIIMGSKVDAKTGRAIATVLKELGIQSEMRVASAHKATHFLMELLAEYERNSQPKVYVTIAGRSNALSAVVDAHVSAPVIACPPYSESFGGADVFSSLRVPSGIATAVVLEPETAALLAAKIIATHDPHLRDRLQHRQSDAATVIERDDAELRGKEA